MSKSPKTIATINFKGGVGKTTVTWCLGDIVSSFSDSKVLLFDLDAQMSLTQAIGLNEDGNLFEKFSKWYTNATEKRKTIFDALDKFARPGERFDFPIGFDFIYQITEDLHFVPSVEDLYWMELEIFDREGIKEFIRRLLGKIGSSPKVSRYDYVLFDCPPSFTLLSYSVLSCCDLILIPVNPDFFASKGTNLILNSLKMRIEPFPLPKIGVFMNKTKTYYNQPTKESSFYMREVSQVCAKASAKQNIRAEFFKSWIPDRVGVKRAITSGGGGSQRVGRSFQKVVEGGYSIPSMNENEAGFRDKHQELERLIQELKQTKDLLKDVASRMSQIERHVKRAFIPLPVNTRPSKNLRSDRPNKAAEVATISDKQALAIFDELKSLSLSIGNEQAVERLERMSAPDLKIIAHELGVTFKSKPSKRSLVSAIRGRLNESLLLSKNVNVTQPRSASLEPREFALEEDEMNHNSHDNEAPRR